MVQLSAPIPQGKTIIIKCVKIKILLPEDIIHHFTRDGPNGQIPVGTGRPPPHSPTPRAID